MKLLVTWFTETSKVVSLLLGELLGRVLPFAEVCISAEDIHSGTQWLSEISALLESTEFAILTLTGEDFNSPWVLIETGYLLNAMGVNNVRVVVVDVAETDLSAPMAQVETVRLKKEDVLELAHAINQRAQESRERGMGENELQNAFETYWPDFESDCPSLGRHTPHKARADREVLYEILELSRGIARTVGSRKLVNSGDAGKTLTKARPIGGEKRSPADQNTLAELTELVEELTAKKGQD